MSERKKGQKKKYRRLRRRLRIHVFLQLLIIVCVALYVRYGDTLRYYIDTVKELHEEAEAIVSEASYEDFGVAEQNAAYPSAAYAVDGTLISLWKGGRGAFYVPLSEMPQAVIDAVVCVEDKRFYEHRGVDYKALLRAFFSLVKNQGKVTQGGSTVTMQLARTMYLSPEVSWKRFLLPGSWKKNFPKKKSWNFT